MAPLGISIDGFENFSAMKLSRYFSKHGISIDSFPKIDGFENPSLKIEPPLTESLENISLID